MKRGRVEVSAVRPYHRMNFRVDAHLVKKGAITEGTKEFSTENWRKIDPSLQAVRE